jgi:sugar phosphate isomerase/epimerase
MPRYYCSAADELCELVDALKDPRVGICWDFGHGNLNKLDQEKSLRAIGKRLKALHVDDNHGWADEHLLPFQGNVPWTALMPVLREIGYEGDMTMEVSPPYNCSGEFVVTMGRHLFAAAAYLVECYEQKPGPASIRK